MRLENYRDGLEDHGLLTRLAPAAMAAITREALSFRPESTPKRQLGDGVNVTVGPAGLERLRRRAAAAAIAERINAAHVPV